MRVELMIPIDSLRGKLSEDGFYFRKYRGQQLVQKCPNRSGHVKTPAEAANQQRFAQRERFSGVAKLARQMRDGGSKKSWKQLWKIATTAYDAAH